MDKKKVEELIEQILNYCDQCYNPNWQPKSFEEFIKLGNVCREAIKELSKSDWVSVEDGLPEYKEDVLVCNKTYPNRMLTTTRCKGVFYDNHNFIIQNMHVTHWKPIEKLEV